MESEQPLRDRLIIELSILERDVRRARMDSVNTFRMWKATGEKNQELLQKFFENHFKSIEFQSRIEWIQEILEATA